MMGSTKRGDEQKDQMPPSSLHPSFPLYPSTFPLVIIVQIADARETTLRTVSPLTNIESRQGMQNRKRQRYRSACSQFHSIFYHPLQLGP